MARLWNRWNSRRDSRDYWNYQSDSPEYGWLKRSLAAIIIFALVYMAHISGTSVSPVVDAGVHYALNTETDWEYILAKVTDYAPKDFDLARFKKVQTTISKPADPLLYMSRPVSGKVITNFGWQTHPVLKQEMMHEGLDFEASIGTSVRASAPGKVTAVSDSAKYGKVVIIKHSQDIETVYGHLGEVLVKPDESVSQGQIIAKVGKTGMTNTPLLYFEMRENGKAVDPMTRLRGDLQTVEGK